MFKTYGFGQSSFGMRRFGFGASDTPPQNVIPTDAILHYDFNGNTADKSASGLNGIQNGTLSFPAGRNAEKKCVDTTLGYLYTSSELAINSDKVSFSFWCKITGYAGFLCIAEWGYGKPLNIGLWVNDIALGYTESLVIGSAGRHAALSKNPTMNQWAHIVMTIDHSQPATATSEIYVDNIKTSVMSSSNAADNNDIFGSALLAIGSRLNTDLTFKGLMQDLRIYNRILTADERTALFNE